LTPFLKIRSDLPVVPIGRTMKTDFSVASEATHPQSARAHG
jgi:hypothetical protein